ncbi:MAG: hypothetical protein LBR36_04305 [Bacteroidales bacterium]|jgi:ABC-type transport system involved in multi-copper enzyme maturation permease subunit|nr:hypothetical protein [Bacteroidales bacterium]
MNKTKFTWAIIVPIFLAVLFGIVSFLGANFLNISNDKVWGMSHTLGCVIMAVVIALLLGGTAAAAILLKRTSRNFKTCFIWEAVCVIFFVLFAWFFASKTSPFPHCFTVMSHRAEIKEKLQTSIIQAENMFASYESYAGNRENLYKHKLESVAAANGTNPSEYKDYGFDGSSGVPDASQIETKMFTVHADLFPTNYRDTVNSNGIKEVATEWLQNAKNVTNSPVWIIGISSVVNDIEKKSNEWLNTLVTLSQVREQGEVAADFEYPLGFNDVKTVFSTLESPKGLAVLLAVVAYVLMLLAYIFTKRSTKSTYGFRALFCAIFSKKEKKTSNNFDIEY